MSMAKNQFRKLIEFLQACLEVTERSERCMSQGFAVVVRLYCHLLKKQSFLYWQEIQEISHLPLLFTCFKPLHIKYEGFIYTFLKQTWHQWVINVFCHFFHDISCVFLLLLFTLLLICWVKTWFYSLYWNDVKLP